MKLNPAKNILIVLLVFTALYQTERLWFGEFSSRNFFYGLFPFNVNLPASEDNAKLVNPYRMVVNFGNNTYQILYNGLDSHSLKLQADTAIRQALKEGQFEETKEINWNDILKNRSVLYEYKISMPIDIFMTGIGQRSNAVPSRVKAFDTLVLTSNTDSPEKFTILFLDTLNHTAHQFSFNRTQASEALYNGIATIQGSDLYYISSAQSGFDYFAGNIFIPQWPSQSYRYPIVKTVNPYGELLLDSVGKKVDVFFNNPAAKQGNGANGVYTYGDEFVVVKYYPNHVLEYSDYTTYDKNTTSNLLSDYGSAVAFITRDNLVVNEYYLSDYIQEEDKRTFYFDYAINNVPLTISAGVSVQIDMKHPIEITVEKGNVIKYRKLVYNYDIDEDQTEHPTVDFIDSLNEILASKQQEDEDYKGAITRMELGYIVGAKPGSTQDLREQLLLNWYYEINDRSYNVSAQQKQEAETD